MLTAPFLSPTLTAPFLSLGALPHHSVIVPFLSPVARLQRVRLQLELLGLVSSARTLRELLDGYLSLDLFHNALKRMKSWRNLLLKEQRHSLLSVRP
jgi:hypothetical protein